MSTFIICILLAGVSVIAILSYRKDIQSGCCERDESIKQLKVKDKNKENYRYKKEILIDGMVCKNCAARVHNAFLKKEGTYPIVDLTHNSMSLYLKQDMSDQEIKDTIMQEGYFVLSIK